MRRPDAERGPTRGTALAQIPGHQDRLDRTVNVNNLELRRLHVRRDLTEAAAVILGGLESDTPLDLLICAAYRLIESAYLEALRAALGDER